MKRFVSLVSFSVLLSALLASPSLAELPAEFGKRITVELRQANVKNVYRLYGDVLSRQIRVDDCLDGRTVDVRLKNAPMSLVLDVMDAKLDAVHALQPDGVLLVSCKAAPGATSPAAPPQPSSAKDRRITIDVRDTDLEKVVQAMASFAGAQVKPLGERALTGKVTMSVKNVRLETAMAVLRESLDLEVLDLVDGELVVGMHDDDEPR